VASAFNGKLNILVSYISVLNLLSVSRWHILGLKYVLIYAGTFADLSIMLMLNFEKKIELSLPYTLMYLSGYVNLG
jgi:hypothetical protein